MACENMDRKKKVHIPLSETRKLWYSFHHHHHYQSRRGSDYGCRENFRDKPHDSILDFVGNTPLIKLIKIPKDHGVSCDIYAKCEFMNPGGSIKDRIALAMMQNAQRHGKIQANTTLVEPTSGNTGIGVAFNCALSDNKCIIVTEDKNSDEKINTIRLLGAEVIQVKSNEDEIRIANSLRDDFPDHIMLNQFENDINPKSHYHNTGMEIVAALPNVDMVVMGAGTGGTITGVGVKVKESFPNCKVVAAEPDGSILINEHGTQHDFLVEGIGGTWTPMVLDKTVVDEIEVANDEESFLMARELARKEGLLCGGSSGSAMVCAIKAAKRLNLGPGKRIVVILPDGIRNYMSKFVSGQWMEAHLFMDPPHHTMKWWNEPITRLELKSCAVIRDDYTCAKALHAMKNNIALVVDDQGRFLGAVTKDSLRNYATNPTKLPGDTSEDFDFDDVVTRYMFKHVRTLAKNGRRGMPTMGRLSRTLDITPFVVIGTINYDKNNNKDYFIADGVATGDDVLDYIFAHSK